MTSRLRGGESGTVPPLPARDHAPAYEPFDSDLGLCSTRPHGVSTLGVGHPTFPTPNCPDCGWPIDTIGHEVNCCEENR
jgi:hypothetical protein